MTLDEWRSDAGDRFNFKPRLTQDEYVALGKTATDNKALLDALGAEYQPSPEGSAAREAEDRAQAALEAGKTMGRPSEEYSAAVDRVAALNTENRSLVAERAARRSQAAPGQPIATEPDELPLDAKP